WMSAALRLLSHYRRLASAAQTSNGCLLRGLCRCAVTCRQLLHVEGFAAQRLRLWEWNRAVVPRDPDVERCLPPLGGRRQRGGDARRPQDDLHHAVELALTSYQCSAEYAG